MNNVPRTSRVAALLEEQLGDVLLREVPELARQVSITRVVVSKDLKYAKVWLDISGEDEVKILKDLEKKKGKIRHELAQRIVIYTCPELRFVRDESADYVRHIDELIAEIHKQDEK